MLKKKAKRMFFSRSDEELEESMLKKKAKGMFFNRSDDEVEESMWKKAKGMFFNEIDREDLKPGDHVYSWRIGYSYAHHGIYVGDGMVIHFTRQAGEDTGTGTFLNKFLVSSSPPSSGVPCEICGDQSKLHGVIKSCLECFLNGGELHIFRYSVSPAVFFAQARGGTCTIAASDPPEDVLHRAKYLLENGFGNYCIFKNNCEDFAIYCKTELLVTSKDGFGRSGQLRSFMAATNAIVSAPLRIVTSNLGVSSGGKLASLASYSLRIIPTSFVGVTVLSVGIYCYNRYKSDIGVREDVKKTPVETLVGSMLVAEPTTTQM